MAPPDEGVEEDGNGGESEKIVILGKKEEKSENAEDDVEEILVEEVKISELGHVFQNEEENSSVILLNSSIKSTPTK